jgi:multisubunit Na+/H+ antiporter MnhB subunit
VAVGASADEGYWNVVQGIDRLSVLVTGTTQRGSLPAYLGTILVTVLALPGTLLLTRAPWPGEWRAWDTPVQAVVGVVVVTAAALTLRIRQRLSAVLVVGVTGYGIAVVFALQGAPDLALTQFLVETLTLVVFVLVLRKLPKDITERHRPRERAVRGVIAVAVGALMAAAGAVVMSVRTATPVSVDYPEAAYDFGGGQNIVNVTLVDIRAWDTLGEISLLVVAGHRRGEPGVPAEADRRGRPPRPGAAGPAGAHVPPSSAGAVAGRLGRTGSRAAVGDPRGDHQDPVPHDSWSSRSTCSSRAQRARRRLRRRPGRGPGTGAALPGRRALRARRGRAGRAGPAAGQRAALRRWHRRRRPAAGRRGLQTAVWRRRCRCSATSSS